jgi:hypothetical protein
VQQSGTATALIDQRATTVAATQTAVANAGFAQRTAIAVTQTAEVLVIQQTQQAQQLGSTATVQAQQIQATGTAQTQQTSLAQIATSTAVAQQTALVQQTATAVAGQTATAIVGQTAVAGQTATAVVEQTAVAGQTATAVVEQTATAAALQTATAAIEQTAVSLTATASVPNEIAAFNFSPPSPVVVPIGFHINVNFTYTTREPGGVQIWFQPYFAGSFAPGGFFGGSVNYPSGSGSGTTFFGTNLPAGRIDGVRILMRSVTSTTILFDQIVPVTYIIP